MSASRSTLSRALSASSFVRRTPRVVRQALTAACFCSLAACGAGIHALYEGDVRFEHCMALEDTADVKPTMRIACWDEWLKFYTFGQTSDRIDYATVRLRRLRLGDNAPAEELASESRRTDAVPEPTTALAPPPMLLVVDAGFAAPEKKDDEQAKPPGSACSSTCDNTWLKCKKECVTPMCDRQSCIAKCEQSCTEEHATCMRFCFM